MRKTLCVAAALVGMVLVSGVIQNYINGGNTEDLSLTGIIFGIGAGALYATIILINKKLKDISSYDTTVVQLASAYQVQL